MCHQEGYSDEDDGGGGVLRIGGIAIRTGGDGGIRHVKRKQARRAAHPLELGSPGVRRHRCAQPLRPVSPIACGCCASPSLRSLAPGLMAVRLAIHLIQLLRL